MRFDNLEVRDQWGGMAVPEPELQQLASEIHLLYVQQRQRLAPSGRRFAPVGQKHAPHFYRAAELCRELGLTAEQYVQEVLEYQASTGNFWPNGVAAIAAFKDDPGQLQDEREHRALQSYRAQLDLLRAREKLFGTRRVLLDRSNALTALVRWWVADEHGWGDITERERYQARVELRANPIARSVFGQSVEKLEDERE